MTRHSVPLLLVTLIASTVVVLSCSKDTTSPSMVAAVVVTPGGDTLTTLGRTRQFTGVAQDAGGHPLSSATLVWHSTNPAVATVDSTTGLVTAVGNGLALVRATASGVTGEAIIEVSQVVATVTVTPGSASITAVGDTQRFTAVSKDSGGAVIASVRFLWGSSDQSVGTVDTNGLVKSKGPGQTIVTAAGRGIPGNAVLTVTQAAALLVFAIGPSSGTAGEAINPAIQVEVRDSGGTLVAGARTAITLGFGINPSGATLHGSVTVNAVGGVATFSGITIETADVGYTLVATATATNQATSAPFIIVAAAPQTLRFVSSDTSDTAGQGLPFIVRSLDRFANPSPVTGSVFIRIANNPTAAGLVNGGFAPSFVGSVADLSLLSIEKAGVGYTLIATGAGGAAQLDSAFSPQFTVKAASPGTLTVTQQPHTVHLGELFIPTKVGAQDIFGNTTTLPETVTVAVGTNPWGASLSGTLVRSGSGLLSFDSLLLNKPGLGYTLVLSAPGLTPAVTTPIDVLAFIPTEPVAGESHSCALMASLAACWGNNSFGQLGSAGAEDSVPVLVSGFRTLISLTAGARHTCGLDSTGAAYCWGDNTTGQLGNAAAGTGSAVPVAVSGGHQFVQLSAGSGHTCGIVAGGATFCWGDDAAGQLGDSGKVASTSVPTAVFGGRAYLRISAGLSHTCAIGVADSAAYCWGANTFGQLGDGAATPGGSDTAVTVSGGLKVRAIAAGGGHTCAVTIASAGYCWGHNDHGQLGNHNLGVDSDVPVAVSTGAIFTIGGALTAGDNHSCGQYNGTDVVCWGSNASGELGSGTAPTDNDQPIRLPVAFFTHDVTAGGSHTCAAIQSLSVERLQCWGDNSHGAVGDGTTTNRSTAVPVIQQ